MKKILIGLILLTFLSWAAWVAMHSYHRDNSTPAPGGGATSTSQESASQTYSDPHGRFTFTYPANWNATGEEEQGTWDAFGQRPGKVLAKVSVPREYLPGTNFSEAWFIVWWSNDPQVIKECSGTKEKSDAAAGNRYDTTAERNIRDGDCISLEYTIRYGNIQNYDPNSGIKEFDEAKLKAELDAVAQSFVWNVNSD